MTALDARELDLMLARARITPDPVSGQLLRALAVLVYVMCAACALLR